MSWPKIKLQELVDINIGRTPSRDNSDYWGEGVPWLSIKDMNQGKKLCQTAEQITLLAAKETKCKVAKKGTVLFSFKLSIGKVGIAEVDMFHNEAIAAMPIKEGVELCEEYLYFALMQMDSSKNTDRAVMGATLNKKKMAELEIPLPPLKTQKKIAEVLEKADQLRKDCLQVEQELNNLAQSVFIDMFGDQLAPPHKSLGDVSSVVSGVTKGQKHINKVTVKAPYMRVANVQAGYLNLSEIKEIEVKESDVEKYKLEIGDVLLTEGGDHDKLGRGAIWKDEIENCIHQNHVFRVRLDSNLYTSEWFNGYLKTTFAKRYFLKCAKKTTNLASINITQLKGLPMPAIEMDDQRHFEYILKSINRQASANKSMSQECDAHFNALMQKAFKGELNL